MQEFTMTQEDHDTILAAINAARGPLIMLQCGPRPTIQETANDAWERLGKKMGFKFMTVRPGKSPLHFFAEPL